MCAAKIRIKNKSRKFFAGFILCLYIFRKFRLSLLQPDLSCNANFHHIPFAEQRLVQVGVYAGEKLAYWYLGAASNV